MRQIGDESTGDLLERDGELAAIDAFARDERAAVLVVEGPAGAGKTRLLSALREAVGQDAQLLAARGTELECAVPFGVAARLLAPLVGPDPGALPAGAAAAFSLFGAGDAGDAIRSPEPVAHALLALLAQGEQRPLLVVDDLHWVDAPSLLFLAQLAARGDEAPARLAVGVRSGEAPADALLLAAIVGAPDTITLRPPPLSPDAVQRLVRAALPDARDADVDAVARVTAGNPFLVREVARSLAQTDGDGDAGGGRAQRIEALRDGLAAPERVARSVRLALARLGPDAQALAEAVAIAGESPLRRVAALAQLAPRDADRAADALAAAAILEPGEPVRFVHPLTAAAVAGGLPGFRVARLHRDVARLLGAEAAPVEHVANHLLHARPEGDAAAVDVLVRAAGVARGRGEPAQAITLLERALDEPPDPGQRSHVLVSLGAAELASGRQTALPRFRAALDATDDPELRVAAWHGLSQAELALGRFGPAADAAAHGRSELPDGDPRGDVLFAAEFSAATLSPRNRERGQALSAQALRRLRTEGPPSEPRLAAVLVGLLGWRGVMVEQIVPLVRTATREDPIVDAASAPFALLSLVGALAAADELLVAHVALDGALERAAATGHALAGLTASTLRAHVRLLQGDFAGADADLPSAADEAIEGWALVLPRATNVRLWMALMRGDIDVAEAALERLEPFESRPLGRLDRGWVRLAQDRPDEALEAFLAAGRSDEEQLGCTNPGMAPWRRGASLALTRLGDRERAAGLARAEAARAREVRSLRPLALALSALGQAVGGDEGLAAHAEAVAVMERSPSRMYLPGVLLEHGAALRRAGQPLAARPPLARAIALAQEIGLGPILRRARHELRAAGGRSERAGRSGVASLTPTELHVARLAAERMTTPQIAELLVVSRRTVETHLASSYRKLGIGSRRELGEALG